MRKLAALAAAFAVAAVIGAMCVERYAKLQELFAIEAQMNALVEKELMACARARRATDRYRMERRIERETLGELE